MSQYETEVTEGVFPLGGVNGALAQYFSGTSYMNTLVNDPDVPVTVANVSFEPGVRNNWHKHNGGFQIILATAGEGRREALARCSWGFVVLPPCYHGRYGRMAGTGRAVMNTWGSRFARTDDVNLQNIVNIIYNNRLHSK